VAQRGWLVAGWLGLSDNWALSLNGIPVGLARALTLRRWDPVIGLLVLLSSCINDRALAVECCGAS